MKEYSLSAAGRFRASDSRWRFPAGAGGISTASCVFPHLPPTTYPLPSAVSRVGPRPGIRARGWDPDVGTGRDLSRSDWEPPLLVQRGRSGGMTPQGSICLRKNRKFGAPLFSFRPPLHPLGLQSEALRIDNLESTAKPQMLLQFGSSAHCQLSISDVGKCVTRGELARPSWP